MTRIFLSLATACFLAGCLNEPTSVEAPSPGPDSPTMIKDVSVETAVRLIKEKPELVILDIRTPQEFAEGHLDKARLIDFNSPDFSDKLHQLDPATPYLVHCASGGRSGQSLVQFSELGFSEIYHLKDGYKGWVASGNPVINEVQ